MSSTNKTANYQLSQFVGTDIPSILNDYNGDMRKIDSAIKEVANAGGDNATAVAELQATVGQHTTVIGGLNSTVNSLSGRVIGIEGKIPADASEENPLITNEELTAVSDDVKAIMLCMPSDASSDNKLAVENAKVLAEISANTYNSESAFNDFLNTLVPSLNDYSNPKYHMVVGLGGNEIILDRSVEGNRWSGVKVNSNISQDRVTVTYGYYYPNSAAMPNGYLLTLESTYTPSTGAISYLLNNAEIHSTDNVRIVKY